jgi:hypothetical protein
MNKFINATLFFIFLPTMAFTIVVGFDLPLESFGTSGAQLEIRDEVFLGLGILIMLINVRRSLRRWMGLRIVNQIEKFKWNIPVSVARKKRVQVYTIMEVFVFSTLAYGLYWVSKDAWMPATGFLFGAVDGLLFTITGSSRNRFRIGVTSKAIVSGDRDVCLVYFKGLRKISIHQDSIYFDYIKKLQLSIPLDCVAIEERENFFKAVENQIDLNRVFVTRERGNAN